MAKPKGEAVQWKKLEEVAGLSEDQFGDIRNLVAEYTATKCQIELLEDQKKKIGAEIEGYMAMADEKRLQVLGFHVALCNGRTGAKIDGRLLVEAGVSTEVVERCTIPGKEYTYIQVKEAKSGGAASNEE